MRAGGGTEHHEVIALRRNGQLPEEPPRVVHIPAASLALRVAHLAATTRGVLRRVGLVVFTSLSR